MSKALELLNDEVDRFLAELNNDSLSKKAVAEKYAALLSSYEAEVFGLNKELYSIEIEKEMLDLLRDQKKLLSEYNKRLNLLIFQERLKVSQYSKMEAKAILKEVSIFRF